MFWLDCWAHSLGLQGDRFRIWVHICKKQTSDDNRPQSKAIRATFVAVDKNLSSSFFRLCNDLLVAEFISPSVPQGTTFPKKCT